MTYTAPIVRNTAVGRDLALDRKDAGLWWQITRPVEHCTRQFVDRLAYLRHPMMVAHLHFPSAAICRGYQGDDWAKTAASIRQRGLAAASFHLLRRSEARDQ